MSVGSLIYKFFYAPIVQPIKKLQADGWFIGRYNLKRGIEEMKAAAEGLQVSCATPDETTLPWIHFLTGKHHWYQTIFCIHSLLANIDIPVHIVIHDDGTFDDQFVKKVKKQVKNCSIDLHADADKRVNETLPEDEYPNLRKARKNFPLFYKLMDCRIGYKGYHVLLDSDMLFFNRPLEFIEWLKNPDEGIYMKDKFQSYKYSYSLLERVLEKPITDYINSGVTGLNNDTMNWKEFESRAEQMISNEGVNYFFEQTQYAMHFSLYGGRALEEKNYIVIPNKKEVLNGKGHLHHYPTGHRNWYYRKGWRKTLV